MVGEKAMSTGDCPRRIPSLVIVRGAGDLASGVIARLVRSGFSVAALETERPLAIRRAVSFSEAVYEGGAVVEGIEALRVSGADELASAASPGRLSVLVDPDCLCLRQIRPGALVDAIMAKRNLGTRIDMADLVIALGPGFTAGRDAHAVIETKRGHRLGRALWSGRAEDNTGVPGPVLGHGLERVLHAPVGGMLEALRSIGDRLRAGEELAAIEGEEGRVLVASKLDGVLRGLIRPGMAVSAGLKIADVDPRGEPSYCFTISDKALAVGGGVLEALLQAGMRPMSRV